MPQPVGWHPGMAGQIMLPPLAKWQPLPAVSSSPAIPYSTRRIDDALRRVAHFHRRFAKRRLVRAGWPIPNGYADVVDTGATLTYDGSQLTDLYGATAFRQPGVQSVTYMAVVFANEVLRQQQPAYGLQPSLREAYVLACNHADPLVATPVMVAATDFDGMCREWPDARCVEGE